MLEHNHELSSYLVADALVPKIKLKWNQVNPKLVIIRDKCIQMKIIRDVKFCQKMKSHKVSKKQKEVFLRKLETLLTYFIVNVQFWLVPQDLVTLFVLEYTLTVNAREIKRFLL